MIIQNILVSLFVFIILPAIVGNGILLCTETKGTFKLSYAYGWIVILALFQLVALPVTFCKGSLTLLVYIYSGILGFVLFGVLICGRKKMKKRFSNIKFKIPQVNLYGILAIVLLIIQITISVFYMHSDADDAYYIGTSVTSLSTDTLYMVAPDTGFLYDSFPWRYVFSTLIVFWAYLSRITFIHPLIITHTIMAPIFILVSYIIWWEFGKCFFKEQENRWILFLLLNVFNIWGNTSAYTQSSFLLFRIWQGKAMLPNIILPMLIMSFLRVYRHPQTWKCWILVYFIVLAGCCCSSMGVPLCAINVMVGSIVLVLLCKKWSMLLWGIISCSPCWIIGIAYLLV